MQEVKKKQHEPLSIGFQRETLFYTILNKSPTSHRGQLAPLEKTAVHHNSAAAVMDGGERWGQAGQRWAEGPLDNRAESTVWRGSFGKKNK